MSAITLDQANRIIAAILKRGAEINCRPLSVLVVEPGCKVKAFQKEDGSSMIRFEMAYGKAYAALAMGRGACTRLFRSATGLHCRGAKTDSRAASHIMARQSGRERRGDQDERRQPYQNMLAPSRTNASPF